MTVDRRGFMHPSMPSVTGLRLYGKRVMLRPLQATDFAQWTEVRTRNDRWLTVWEPLRAGGHADPTRSRDAFSARCSMKERDRQAGVSYGFGIFIGTEFAGEVNLNNVVRGALQSATIGYWIDQRQAGHRYVPESVIAVCRFAFEELRLHRIEICIVPRNDNSRRVMEVLRFREEGVAQRYLEIDGVWEDHMRFAITAEEWVARRDELSTTWLS
jgi:[ribosomal protein S5]-alanine N-acetyltransferase